MNKRQRLAALRAEAATLTGPLSDGSATPEQIERANQIVSETTTLQREIAEEDAEAATPAETRTDSAAELARRALADLPADPPPPTPGNRDSGPVTRPGPAERAPARTSLARIAQDFVDSPQYAQYQANGMRGSMGGVVADVTPVEMTRAVILTTDNPNRNPYVPGILEPAYRPLTLLDVLDSQTTGLDSIDYIQETTADPGAGATEVAEGAAKPEVATTMAEATSPVRVIAAWLQMTRQTAEDRPTVAGYLQGRLGFKVQHRLNSQVVNGNGTAPNIRGLLATVGINTVAPAGAEARIISIRKAITQCQIDEYMPQAVIMAPSDWELVELSTDNNGSFRVSPNVQASMARTLWGLQVIVDTVIAAGTALVGDFRLGATLWQRQGVTVYMTDSHASTFISNVITILAEMRAALTVWRPSAFCKVTFNGTI